MKIKLSTFLLAAVISCPVVSFAMESVPPSCPGVESIKKVPFNQAGLDYWVGWIAVTPKSQYDTPLEWTTAMMLGKVDSEDPQVAIDKANGYLPLMQVNVMGPEKSSGGWWCFYTDGTDNSPATTYSFTKVNEELGETLAKVSTRFQRLQHR